MRKYDFSDLKDIASDAEHKHLMLEMLIEFDAFCAQHGLTYYLSGGTLLGAARHTGFIPWDDDVDINMPRPDCEKLMELSGGKIGPYQLVAPNWELNTFSYHWKMYGDSILVAKRTAAGVGDKVYPVFMDIFPIEGLPDSEEANERHYATIRALKNRVNHARGVRIYRGFNPAIMIINRLLSQYYRVIGLEKLFAKVIDHAKSLRFEDSKHIGVMMTNVHTTEERVVKSEYTPVIKMDFEGHPLSCPAGYDTYLRQLYGPKYMELLSVHKRFSRHNLVTFRAFEDHEKPSTGATIRRPDAGTELSADELDMQLDEL